MKNDTQNLRDLWIERPFHTVLLVLHKMWMENINTGYPIVNFTDSRAIVFAFFYFPNEE
jgi:hypothetical protein